MSDREARQIIRSAIGTLCREAGAQFTFARADELNKVLARMARMEADR